MSVRQRGRSMAAAAAWWILVTAAILAASAWLRTPMVQYLALGGLATVAAGALLVRRPAPRSPWMWATIIALLALHAVAVPAQLELDRIADKWAEWQRVADDRAHRSMTEGLDAAIADAQAAVTDALGAPFDRAAAFEALSAHGKGEYDRGVAVFNGDIPFAWAGEGRAPLSPTSDGVSILTTPVYVELRVSRSAGARRATAYALIDASSPGDSVARPLTRVVAEQGVVRRIVATPAVDGATAGSRRYLVDSRPLLELLYEMPSQGEVAYARREDARIKVSAVFAIALISFIVAVWRASRGLSPRLAVLGLGLISTAIVPVSQYSNASRLFDPSSYFAPIGRQLTANAGALLISSALVLLGVIAIVRSRRRAASRLWTTVGVTLIAGLGPFLLRDLARGIQIPRQGVDAALWLMWEIPLFLAGVAVLLAAATVGGVVVGRTRGLHPALAPVFAGFAALIGPIVWQAPGQWPWWYTFLWIGAIAALAMSRQTRYLIIAASTVAALGSITLVWGRSARGRVELAQSDLQGLGATNQAAALLLQRFGEQLASSPGPGDRAELLKAYVSSDLAPAQYPVTLTSWSPSDELRAAFHTSALFTVPGDSLRALLAAARRSNAAIVRSMPGEVAMLTVLAAPASDGGITIVGVGPQSRLFAPDPVARLLGLGAREGIEPPYVIQLRDRVSPATGDTVATWRREESELHGDWTFRSGPNAWGAHLEVELRTLDVLIQRGALIVVLDLVIVAVLWAVGVVADGRAGRWLRARRRRWWGSYRARLSLVLFAFFLIPAAAFAAWSYRQLANDARQQRQLLVTETLRAADSDSGAAWLGMEGRRLRTPLLLYSRGELRLASDSLLAMLAPFGRLLDPAIENALAENREEMASVTEPLGSNAEVLVGYRSLPRGLILAAPARADDASLGRRRRDLGVLVLFATALGALGALWLSGIAARQLARPIRNLREAALSIGGGERMPTFEVQPTVEFQPVFSAFRRMASDLNASRSELEQAQRRTTAVLRNVASGVIAIDEDAHVTLANPRAELVVGAPLPAGTSVLQVAPALAGLIDRGESEDPVDLEINGAQLRGRMTKLGKGGAVITLDDVSEIARAQRVLAWGEMARQIAHEIKNPLTPIRLGVQHLKRARTDARVDFDKVLDQNVSRILAEIDRLDEIARAFSRYGSVPEERPPAEAVDVAAIVRDVVALEQMGTGDGVRWSISGADAPVIAMARSDELKEVLLNLLENARHAHARHVGIEAAREGEWVVLRARDDGEGIPPDVLPRVFEPHFSTKTSGSGLGLAISRQIIDGWNGSIDIQSATEAGTVVTIRLRAALVSS